MSVSRGWGILRVLAAVLASSTAAQATPYLWQLNAWGNDIHIFNLDDFRLVRRLDVGRNPHGIAVPKDQRMIYVSLERYRQPHGELLWINPASLDIERRMQTCEEPQNIAVTPDGKWLYVPCKNGEYWVVDTGSGTTVKKISTGGRPHNAKASSDGRHTYLSPLGNPHGVTVVDVAAGHRATGFIPFGGQVRPLDLSRDGQLLFQQVDGVNGFRVADIEQSTVIKTVRHSIGLGWFRPVQKLMNRVSLRLGYGKMFDLVHCHGLAVRPDQKEVWSTCGHNLSVHSLDHDNYAETAHLQLGGTGYWLSFAPDGRYAAVALSDRDQVAIVDAREKRIVRLLPVGHGPRRNIVIDEPVRDGSIHH
ncbi:MAG: YncE family protein [Thiogranum sp.]|jgi:DNA-binding beta-propeller fold protein YncE|nr:YncE family protein [Thiogranum sp.]